MREHRASTGRGCSQPPSPLPRLQSLATQPASRHPPILRAVPSHPPSLRGAAQRRRGNPVALGGPTTRLAARHGPRSVPFPLTLREVGGALSRRERVGVRACPSTSSRHREERSDEAIPSSLEGVPPDLPPVTDQGPSPDSAPGVRGPLGPGSPPRARAETAPLATGQREPRWGLSGCVQLLDHRGRPACPASAQPPRLRLRPCMPLHAPHPASARSLVAPLLGPPTPHRGSRVR
jgi:hypothetical protein